MRRYEVPDVGDASLIPSNTKKCTVHTCRMAKFDKEAMKKTRLMVANLKSTGQSKFALEDDKGEVSKLDYIFRCKVLL